MCVLELELGMDVDLYWKNNLVLQDVRVLAVHEPENPKVMCCVNVSQSFRFHNRNLLASSLIWCPGGRLGGMNAGYVSARVQGLLFPIHFEWNVLKYKCCKTVNHTC